MMPRNPGRERFVKALGSVSVDSMFYGVIMGRGAWSSTSMGGVSLKEMNHTMVSCMSILGKIVWAEITSSRQSC